MYNCFGQAGVTLNIFFQILGLFIANFFVLLAICLVLPYLRHIIFLDIFHFEYDFLGSKSDIFTFLLVVNEIFNFGNFLELVLIILISFDLSGESEFES